MMLLAAVAQTLTIGPTFFETAVFDVPKFDPALGTLQSVEVSGHLYDRTKYGVEFLCVAVTGRSSTTFTNHSYSEIFVGGTAVANGSGGESQTLTAASLFDGTLDLDGNSGRTLVSSYEYDITPSVTGGLITGSLAARFSGTGTIPVSLTVHRTQSYGNSTGQCGQTLNFAVLPPDNNYTYTLTVTYNY